MRKILSILASVGLTATAASAVVACGNTDKNGVVQSGSLGSIVKSADRTVSGNADMTSADKALSAFLETAAGKRLKKENVQVKENSFEAAGPGTNGKLVIQAKSGTKYTGEITITIKGYTVTLESIKANLTLEIPGSENMTADSALAAFLAVDANKTLRDEVEVKGDAESFDAPKNGVDGKLVITAKSSSTKYTGVLEITISKLKSSAEPTTPEGQNKERVSSSNDDHKVTIITLSTEDALRLGYIKQDGDKFVAGDKLPNGPLTTKVGESTITATFTPNFENGTVQVVLTVDTPSNN